MSKALLVSISMTGIRNVCEVESRTTKKRPTW